MLQLELGKIYECMKNLKKENKLILQRWLKKINNEVSFYDSKLDAHSNTSKFQSIKQRTHLETHRIHKMRK
ncbi:4536_t:CDS:2 [Cetraspora pellucida]|uniref:4536_t:CDS:1 n=1 Tax=Cetraspora pellucida TaxID=1433469 RepID=A0ACA9KPR0_9GLOM|nr:4536_t:CDS:2 [Cetraspora pellucida]